MWPANRAPWLATLLCHSKPCHTDHVTANGSKTSTTRWLLYLPKAWGAASLGTLPAPIPPPSPARIISHVMPLLVNKAFMADHLLVMYTSLTFPQQFPALGEFSLPGDGGKKTHPWWGVFFPPFHRNVVFIIIYLSVCCLGKGVCPQNLHFFCVVPLTSAFSLTICVLGMLKSTKYNTKPVLFAWLLKASANYLQQNVIPHLFSILVLSWFFFLSFWCFVWDKKIITTSSQSLKLNTNACISQT